MPNALIFYRVNWNHSEDGAGPGENFYFRTERSCMDFALLHHAPPYSNVTAYRCEIADGDPRLEPERIFDSYQSAFTTAQKRRAAKLKREAKVRAEEDRARREQAAKAERVGRTEAFERWVENGFR